MWRAGVSLSKRTRWMCAIWTCNFEEAYHTQYTLLRSRSIRHLPSRSCRCLTPAAEPPADQFVTLALPAHSRRESRRLEARHRPAPRLPDHWAAYRTEMI